MLMAKFYRQKIGRIDNEIRDAESNRDFKKVAKLQSERLEAEKRVEKIRRECHEEI